MAQHYAAFSLVPRLTLCLGLGALAAPARWQGPLVLDLRSSATGAGLWLLGRSIFLADGIGLGLFGWLQLRGRSAGIGGRKRQRA